MTSVRARLEHLDIRHLAARIDAPGLDRVVVIDRTRAAHLAQLPDRRLHEPGFVDGARLQQCRRAVPRPVDAKARERLGEHRFLQTRRAPVTPAIGRYIDALDGAAPRPRETLDLMITAVEDELPAGRRGDHAFRFMD